MDTPNSSSPEFPVRLNRRLSIASALCLLAVLSAGGLALSLAASIYHINKLVGQEYAHVLSVEQLHLKFHAFLSEIEQIATTEDPDRLQRLPRLQEELADQMKTVMEQQIGQPVPTDLAREATLLARLDRLVAEVQAITARFASDPDGFQFLATNLAGLQSLSEQGAMVATRLVSVHQEGVGQLLTVGQNRMRLIIALYLGLLVAGVAVVGVVGLLCSRAVTNPLHHLARAAQSVAEGHLEVRVPIRSRDEIGKLSHAFNVMAEGLETRERELRSAQAHVERKLREVEILNQIGSAMVAFTGPETILQSIVDKARETLYVDAAAICLTAADSGELKVSATSGPAEAFRAEATMMHRSAGETRGTVHSLAECPAMHSEHIRSHVAFPLKRGRASIGVLCVGSREERSFSAEEQGLLSALAAQAAVTVEHGRLDAQVRGFAVAEERGRIARDMHDGLAQSVSLLHLKARQAQALLTTGKSSLAADTLGELADISASAYDEVRQSIFGLRTMVSGGLGIIPALTELLHEFSERNDLPVKLEADGAEPVRLSPASEFQVIRIVQEALANVRKHAHAQNARVRVERQDSWVRVSVEDDGSGFDPATVTSPKGLHFGLQGMRERAERLGGTLEIVTVPDRGTRVTASLPLENA